MIVKKDNNSRKDFSKITISLASPKSIFDQSQPDEETARSTLEKLFFSDKRYDLGEMGRYRINRKLNLNIDPKTRVLTNEDIVSIIKHLIKLINSKEEVDDIDHLSNPVELNFSQVVKEA